LPMRKISPGTITFRRHFRPSGKLPALSSGSAANQDTRRQLDGILGNVMMRHYDIDLDFAHQKMNFFAPEQCMGAGIYWSPSTISSVPIVAYTGMEYADRSPIPRLGDTYVPVTLDGQVIIALLDTRADRTFINPDVADKLFGLKPDGMEPVSVDDGGTVIKAGTHVFKSLSFGGLTAGNMHVAVPLDVMSQSSKIFHASKVARDTFYLHELMPDMVIGMDLLRHSHLYVSFQNDRVYVSAAGDGPALAASPVRAHASGEILRKRDTALPMPVECGDDKFYKATTPPLPPAPPAEHAAANRKTARSSVHRGAESSALSLNKGKTPHEKPAAVRHNQSW